MSLPFSQFFARLDLPLANTRWSWGARRADTILLRTWSDEAQWGSLRRVMVLREPGGYRADESLGWRERIEHVRALWSGGIAGYVVVAEVQDRDAFPRVIKSYRDDVVFPIIRLESREDGAVMARLGVPVPTDQLAVHRMTHRSDAGLGLFPEDAGRRSSS
jgi:hypothetical protein